VVSIVGDIKWSLMSDIHGLVVSNVGDITCKWSLMLGILHVSGLLCQ
jgi:hypothetical protein